MTRNLGRIFRAGVGIALALPWAGCFLSQSSTVPDVSEPSQEGGPSGNGFGPIVRARNQREVEVELVARYADNKIGTAPVRLRSYNGGLVGPTLRLRPGDTLNVHLINRLPPAPSAPTVHVSLNDTNLHFHGLHVSPAGNSDNVLLRIRPGQDFHYEIKVPRDHPAGTYWYHPHTHGSTSIQVGSGMAGALIIEGDIDRVPEIAAAKEKIFVLEQIQYSRPTSDRPGLVENFNAFLPGAWDLSGRRTIVNGELEPIIEMHPGEVQRWRYIDAGIMEALRMKIEDQDGKPVPQHAIAFDGITTGRIDAEPYIQLYPGYRTDVLVRAGDQEGDYQLVDDSTGPLESLHLLSEERNLIARIRVRGRKVDMGLPSSAELAPLAPFKPVQDAEIGGTQKVEFSIVPMLNPLGLAFQVDGSTFRMDETPRHLVLGAAEEWLVSSGFAEGHTFHIHVNPFEVIEPGGKRYWKDTIFVPPLKTLRLRTRYDRYIGTYVLHCHILSHEDLGMMQLVEVSLPGDPMHEDH